MTFTTQRDFEVAFSDYHLYVNNSWKGKDWIKPGRKGF